MKNWAGNLEYRAAAVVAPASLAELQQLVVAHPQVRPLGSRHSFSDVADTEGVMVDLSSMAESPRLVPGSDCVARSVAVSAGSRYGELGAWLQERGLALANLASLPHISVAGAVATGTHGSGAANRGLASAVGALSFVDAAGALRTVRRGEPEFDGSVVALGLLGVVVELELDVEPTFDVAQRVFLDSPAVAVGERLLDVLALGYSTSIFTRWTGDTVDSVWVKSRGDTVERDITVVPVGRPATTTQHPIVGADAASATVQLGQPGPWHERLPHFRPDFTPSFGDELQSELFVDIDDGPAAYAALRSVGDRIGPALLTSEIRCIAADRLWLSGAYERDTVAFHFTWRPGAQAARSAIALVEQTLAPFAPRAHWGKLTSRSPAQVTASFPRWPDFAELRGALDPSRKFTGPFAERLLAG